MAIKQKSPQAAKTRMMEHLEYVEDVIRRDFLKHQRKRSHPWGKGAGSRCPALRRALERPHRPDHAHVSRRRSGVELPAPHPHGAESRKVSHGLGERPEMGADRFPDAVPSLAGPSATPAGTIARISKPRTSSRKTKDSPGTHPSSGPNPRTRFSPPGRDRSRSRARFCTLSYRWRRGECRLCVPLCLNLS